MIILIHLPNHLCHYLYGNRISVAPKMEVSRSASHHPQSSKYAQRNTSLSSKNPSKNSVLAAADSWKSTTRLSPRHPTSSMTHHLSTKESLVSAMISCSKTWIPYTPPPKL